MAKRKSVKEWKEEANKLQARISMLEILAYDMYRAPRKDLDARVGQPVSVTMNAKKVREADPQSDGQWYAAVVHRPQAGNPIVVVTTFWQSAYDNDKGNGASSDVRIEALHDWLHEKSGVLGIECLKGAVRLALQREEDRLKAVAAL